MDTSRKRSGSTSRVIMIIFILSFSAIFCMAAASRPQPSSCSDTTAGCSLKTSYSDTQEIPDQEEASSSMMMSLSRRNLLSSQLGSSPPRCHKQCGPCRPCKAARVRVKAGNNPGNGAYYYPLVWRCKCNNKLYLP